MAAVNRWPVISAFIGGVPVPENKENDCRHALLLWCSLFGDFCAISEPPKCDFYDTEDAEMWSIYVKLTG